MSKPCHSGVSPSVEPFQIISSHCALDANDGARQRVGDCVEGASPRSVTTGGNLFPPVAPEKPSSEVAHIDWFAFTVLPPDGVDGVQWLFFELVRLVGIPAMTDRGKGWFGYAKLFDLEGYGILACGGESQRGSLHVELNARGCAHVADWQKIQEWGEIHGATITRVDLAHDDFEGERFSVQVARDWLEAGEFGANGRPPAAKLIDDLGSGQGKTLYIGNRKNGKLTRVYEKGKQLGDPASTWTRLEVELRNKGRVIPWEVVTRPGHYLAGAYPCLSFLSAVQEKIRTITKAVTVTLSSAVHHARQSVGKLVNVLHRKYQGDTVKVVSDLIREGIPRRLENYADFLPQVFGESSP